MAKPNYAFEKRQRDLAKQKKKEEKRLKKAGARDTRLPGDSAGQAPPAEATDAGTGSGGSGRDGGD